MNAPITSASALTTNPEIAKRIKAVIDQRPNEASVAERVAEWPESDRQHFLERLDPERLRLLKYEWAFYARNRQMPPEGKWLTWLLMSGRGFGKTRVGAEWVRMLVESGRYEKIALCAPITLDARKILIEGESGIQNVFPPDKRPIYRPSRLEVEFYNGAKGFVYSADEPDRFRGGQHQAAWCDELASWKHIEAFDNLMMGLRLPPDPRLVVTTTPRPIDIIYKLLEKDSTLVTTGSSYDNIANLSDVYFRDVIKPYEGTRQGLQELHAILLSDVPGALWTWETLARCRVNELPPLRRVVIAIDPATSFTERSDATGIMVCGLGYNGHGYVIQDATMQGSPGAWAQRAIELFHEHHADRIVGEVNNGGDMVEHTLRTYAPNIPFTAVHATHGKRTRAEPISAIYEQQRAHHLGIHPMLEFQMCTFVPDQPNTESPDNLDAAVWGLWELMIEGKVVNTRARPVSVPKRSSWATTGPAGNVARAAAQPGSGRRRRLLIATSRED